MRRLSFGKVLALVTATNVLLGAALFVLRPPAGADGAVVPPALPAPVAELEARIGQGHPGEPYLLDLSDEELTALASYVLAHAPDVPFARPKVTVTGEKVVVNGVTKSLAVAVPIRLTSALAAKDGRPTALVEDVSLGQTALPGAVRDQILRAANQSLDLSRYAIPLTVDAVELRPGGVTLHGTLK